MERNLPNYRLLQLGAPDENLLQRNEHFSGMEGLVTHHPERNKNARISNGVVIKGENHVKRSYSVIGGKIQEIETARTDEYHSLGQDQVLVVKDFILEDSRIASGQRDVRTLDVPAPLAGYIGRVDIANGVVDILDGYRGEVIARARHIDPITVQSGESVDYGQSIGTQSNRGLKSSAGKHVHFEIDTRYYQRFENYMEDLASGRLPIDPERRTQGIEARPVVDDGVIRIGESTGVVRHVQQALNEAGFRGADNRPLAVDGVYRLSMQAAVINYQAAHGLAQSGDIDAVTLNQIAPRIMPPAVNETEPGGGIDPRLPHFMNRQSVLPDNGVPRDPLLPQAEEAVRRLGRDYDEQGACMAASVACLAKANGLSRIDHIVLSEARGDLRPGDNLFVVQGALNDPAHHRVQMKTQDAIGMPVEQSLARLQALNDTQPQQSQHPTIGNPARQIDSQVRLS